jgi:hypothetical protein
MHTQFVELPVFDQERHPPETQIARRRDHNGTATNAVATGAHDREVSGQRGQPHGDHQQMTRSLIMTATCSCGGVELKAFGRPIVSSVCYCDDCQKGAGQIEALPNAGTVRDPDGGTAYILYRKDRIECSKGAELLRSYKLGKLRSQIGLSPRAAIRRCS